MQTNNTPALATFHSHPQHEPLNSTRGGLRARPLHCRGTALGLMHEYGVFYPLVLSRRVWARPEDRVRCLLHSGVEPFWILVRPASIAST